MEGFGGGGEREEREKEEEEREEERRVWCEAWHNEDWFGLV